MKQPMMIRVSEHERPSHIQPYSEWLDEETLAELMPEAVVLNPVGYSRSRDTLVTLVENESTDDI